MSATTLPTENHIKLQPDTGVHTVIIRAEPGGILPPHRHIESAEIFVLKGSGDHPQTGHFAVGDFISESKGAVHDPLIFQVETEMLMTSQGPSVFLDEQGNDLYTMDVAMLQPLAQSVAT
ncbi:cupin conserved barrel [Fusarium longipes]|uniref:Cupin conserved barrel n=1 Tax=Fusarium longipes TaxID=694270 RepID=A0A395TAF4_9HYPO|nr:cupin conserved barrel [Fusarium longipes]